jgi:hypothetical protein
MEATNAVIVCGRCQSLSRWYAEKGFIVHVASRAQMRMWKKSDDPASTLNLSDVSVSLFSFHVRMHGVLEMDFFFTRPSYEPNFG